MHSDWFNGIEILQGRWQHGEKVGYCYPSRLEKTLCKWDIYVPLVRKGLNSFESVRYVFNLYYLCKNPWEAQVVACLVLSANTNAWQAMNKQIFHIFTFLKIVQNAQ